MIAWKAALQLSIAHQFLTRSWKNVTIQISEAPFVILQAKI